MDCSGNSLDDWKDGSQVRLSASCTDKGSPLLAAYYDLLVGVRVREMC